MICYDLHRDAHDACSWDSLYDPAELTALHALMGPTGSQCTDTWRHLHPDTDGVYSVWSERTSARAFNVVGRVGRGAGTASHSIA